MTTKQPKVSNPKIIREMARKSVSTQERIADYIRENVPGGILTGFKPLYVRHPIKHGESLFLASEY